MCVFLITLSSDTFASKVAATQDQYADACIGNVTGSNAVNVFLGIGVAWTVAAVYWKVKGKVFHVDPGSLAFSVTLFTIFAFFSMGVLMLRRRPSVGGELGGPRIPKVLTSLLFFGLWFLYILFSSLEAYCHIQGFWESTAEKTITKTVTCTVLLWQPLTSAAIVVFNKNSCILHLDRNIWMPHPHKGNVVELIVLIKCYK